ncbi:MAG TPA: phosphoribosylformylglycinamidine synthase subunit PurS [Candidatus Norongarragalinales archaeon]|nr:phosphoribosylformylglycinamidine synthase subunit PurS [Candidatus Norongarragalinales archaeon]
MEREYLVEITIESKPVLKDPEGAVIATDLMRRHGFEMVEGVRMAKVLRVRMKAANEKKALEISEKMVRDLRLANPVAQNYTIAVKHA